MSQKVTYRVSELRGRPDWHQIVSVGRLSGDGRFITLGDDAPIEPRTDRAVQSSSRPEIARPEPNVARVARPWPLWAKMIRLLRRKPDKGIGDTLERLFKRFGVASGVKWLSQITGHACKCKTRRDGLNISWPYIGV